jgi:sugar lactone lactonase YvrE
MKLNKFSLKDGSTEVLMETDDFIFSIAFSKQTNGIFYSNFTKNNISMFDLDKKDAILYKEDNVLSPKSICLNEDHNRLFFEDNNDGISGFYIKSALVFSWTGHYSKLEIESQQNSRNIISKDPIEMRTKVNCIEYIDDSNRLFISRYKKHSIDYIDDSGKIYKFMGSGKPDFCSSTNPSNISFNCPTGLCFVSNELFVADTNNHIIRRFSKNNEWKELPIIGIPTKEGEQDGDKATFRFPTEICNFNKNIFIIDNGNKIRKIDIDKKEVKTVYSTVNFIKSITCDQDNIYWTEI